MAQERIAYINGEILPENEVKIPFRDRGFMAGDTVFDTTRTFDKGASGTKVSQFR